MSDEKELITFMYDKGRKYKVIIFRREDAFKGSCITTKEETLLLGIIFL